MRLLPGLPLLKAAQLPTEIPTMPAPPKVPASSPVPDVPTVTQELPIVTFGGDIVFTASQDITIDATQSFGDRCTGLLLQSAIGTVQVSINGSPFRTVVSDQAINDAKIRTVRVKTDILSSVILQLHGV